MNKFEFGQKVRITHKLIRRRKQITINSKEGIGIESIEDQRVWIRVENSKVGLYIGQRTLRNGIMDYYGEVDNGGYGFIPKEYFQVALVVCSQNENPIYVPSEFIFEHEESKKIEGKNVRLIINGIEYGFDKYF